MAYWYDAFNPAAIAEINELLPPGAAVSFFTGKVEAPRSRSFNRWELLRGDIDLGMKDASKFPSAGCSPRMRRPRRSLGSVFALKPFYALAPNQLDGLRVASVADPVAVSRAVALNLLASEQGGPPSPVEAPAWVHRSVSWLGRFWGEGAHESAES